MSWINMKGENLIRIEIGRKDAQKLLEQIDHVNEETATPDSDKTFLILRLGDTLDKLLKEEKQ